jgi:hypothetical protein
MQIPRMSFDAGYAIFIDYNQENKVKRSDLMKHHKLHTDTILGPGGNYSNNVYEVGQMASA